MKLTMRILAFFFGVTASFFFIVAVFFRMSFSFSFRCRTFAAVSSTFAFAALAFTLAFAFALAFTRLAFRAFVLHAQTHVRKVFTEETAPFQTGQSNLIPWGVSSYSGRYQ